MKVGSQRQDTYCGAGSQTGLIGSSPSTLRANVSASGSEAFTASAWFRRV